MNILEKIGRTLADAMVQVEKIDPIAGKDIVEFRLGRCLECEHNSTGTKEGTCKLCHCFIDLKAETAVNRKLDGSLEITHCEAGRWDDGNILSHYNTFRNDLQKKQQKRGNDQ